MSLLSKHVVAEVTRPGRCVVTVAKTAVTLAVRDQFHSRRDIESHAAAAAERCLGGRVVISDRRIAESFDLQYEFSVLRN